MSIIGSDMQRVDAPDKARGRARYTGDYSAPGMLHVALARAPIPHGVIREIRIPERPEGVYCYTAADLKSNLVSCIINDQPVLADQKIRYCGEPFAVAAAETREAAAAFAARIQLMADPLPAVDDMMTALAPETPKLFEKGNLCTELHSRKGDAEAAFRDCELVLEDTFRLPVQSHGFLEPESAFTYIDEEGRLALISSTQNVFNDRDLLASMLGLPKDRVTSRAAAVGGAFGGKDGNTAQAYAAIVTHFTGRPARYVFTREENIKYGMKRHSAVVQLKMGFDGAGRILAFRGYMRLDSGAYALLGPSVLELAVEHMPGPYYIPNIDLDGHLVYTNHAPGSAMRGFGGPQAAFAVETLMNRAAAHFGMNGVEIRRINALHRGESGPMGDEMRYSFGFEEALDQLEKTALYQEMLHHPEPGCGYGVAAVIKSSGMGGGIADNAVCEIRRLPNGHFRVQIGLVDIGQGSETANVMMAAEALHVTPDRIEMCMADTEQTLECGATAASRCTYLSGNAILMAAEEILQGKDYARAICHFPKAGEGGIHAMFACLAEMAKVTVDPVTGAVQVLDAVNVTEAGRIINPTMLAGQVFGGIVMSTGYALSEQIRCQEGRTLEDSFNSYVMPSALDAPRLVNINAEVLEESGPFGAKGMSEASTMGIAPAITDALHKLCPGLSITTLPVDREEILRHLPGKEQL